MVWYGIYVSKHKHKENLGTFASVLERLEALGKHSNVFRAFWERMGAFGWRGKLVSIFPNGMVCMVLYGMYVCSTMTPNKSLAQCRSGALTPI